MAFKFLLVLALMVLSESQGQDMLCSQSQRRMVRLQKGSTYAGIVEMCWKLDFEQQYMWRPVCNNGWTSTEAGAVCQDLKIRTTNSGVQAVVTGNMESLQGWRIKCVTAQNCTLATVNIQRCSFGSFAIAICDLPPQTEQPECNSPQTTQQPQDRGPQGCSECSMPTTSSQSSQTGCAVLAGVLGSVIAVALVLLVGMLIGCVWCCRHHKRTVHYIDSTSDDKVVGLADQPGSHLANPTYETNYATISDQVQRVSQATASPSPSRPAMLYDTIEDKVPPPPWTTTAGREPLYHELERATGGITGSEARSEAARTEREGSETEGVTLDFGDGQRARCETTSIHEEEIAHQPGQPADYYEVPVKST